jgi:O-antigen/teichoic acid export membrane protein
MIGKKLINQSLVYGLASLLINGSNFFLIPLYAHYMNTTQYGEMTGVTLFSKLLTTILAFGFNAAIIRYYVEYDEIEFKNFLFSTFLFQIGISLLVSASIVVFNGLFLDRIFTGIPYDPYLRYGVWIGFVGVFSTIPLALLQARSKALGYRLLTTASFVLLTAFMIVNVVMQEQGSIGAVKATLIAGTLMAIPYCWIAWRNSGRQFRFHHVRTALIFSLPLMVYSVFGDLMESSSKYLVENLVSVSSLGVYNIAYQISAVLLLLINAVNMAWLPIFYSEVKKNSSSKLFSDFGAILIFGLTTGGLALSIFANELILIFLPENYWTAAEYLPWLVLSHVVGSGYWALIVNPLTYAKKTIYLPLMTVISGLFSAGMSWFLISMVGSTGAAVAVCASYFLLVGMAYFFFRKYSEVSYDFTRMNKMILIGIGFYLVSTLIHFENPWIGLFAKLLLFTSFLVTFQLLRIYTIADLKAFVQVSTQAKE